MVMDTLKGIVTMATDAQDTLTSELKAQYDAGYADGKASVVLPDPSNPDKLFSQADMDSAVKTAKDEQSSVDQDQISALNKQLLDAQTALAAAQADTAAQVAALKAKALADVKVVEADLT